MRPRTLDLLSLRDNEPMDAAARTTLEAEPTCGAEVERLRATRDALCALPELAPPPGVWDRIAAASRTDDRSAPRTGYLSGAVLAASVAAAALLLTAQPWHRADPPEAARTAPVVEREPRAAAFAVDRTSDQGATESSAKAEAEASADFAETASGAAAIRDDGPFAATPAYEALLEESLRLERLLADVPYQRPVITAGTASTIALLEDRISVIDGQLSIGAADGLEPLQQQALWRDRVDVMNALVQVRFAQALRIAY